MFRQFSYFLVTAMLFVNIQSAKATHINFEKTKMYTEVVAQAQQENKSFFVYFSAKWCAPCQIMNRTAFQDENLAQYIHENVIPVKLDIDQKVGKLWQDQFNVQAVPTMIFFNASGNEIYRESSGMSGRKLLSVLSSIDNGLPIYASQTITAQTINHNNIEIIDSRKKINDINKFTRTNISSKDDRFEIEVGNYFSQDDINRKIEELSTKFEQHKFYIVQRKIPIGTIFQLVLSGFDSIYTAKFASEYLESHNYEPQLVKL